MSFVPWVVIYALIVQWIAFASIDVVEANYQVAEKARRELEKRRNDIRMAVHESGHTLLVWSYNETESFTAATIETKEGGGLTSWRWQDQNGRDFWWCMLAMDVSGLVAEHFFLGYGSVSGARVDLEHARQAADYLLSIGAKSPPWPVDEPATQLEFGEHFASATPEQIRMVNLAAETARDVIRAYGERAITLYKTLFERRTMDEKDVEQILGSRETIRYNGVQSRFLLSKEVLDESGVGPYLVAPDKQIEPA